MSRLAYADPPYPGQAQRHYGREEVDHKELVERLQFYDAWALSTSSPALQMILPLCPPETRVAAWVKPFASFKPGVNPAYAWEPVLFIPARRRHRSEPTVRDWLAAGITMKRGLSGAKPFSFGLWLFDLLQAEPDDCFEDLFTGTGAVTRAWEHWRNQRRAQTGMVLSD